MKRTHRTVPMALLAILAMVLATVAQARTNPEYDDCLLQHLKNARVDVAAQMITQACHQNYVDDNFMSTREKKRNDCLLENLPGIESIDAIARVTEVCDRKSKQK